MGNTTKYVYDPGGNQTKIIDPLGNTTEFGYDVIGRKTWQQNALAVKYFIA